jgi:acyl-CoA synthetase (AMP-forming)/AMP-acid ligase II
MDYGDLIEDYGITGLFDTQSAMRGEAIAIILRLKPNRAPQKDVDDECDDDDEDDDEREEDNEEHEPYEGITFHEIEAYSKFAAAQLYHRHGIRAHDRVLLLLCPHGNPGAEVVAMLACIRIGAIFIPIDPSWISASTQGASAGKFAEIVNDAAPSAAVCVASSDEDYFVKLLASHGIHHCCLINEDGSPVILESSNSDIREDLPEPIIPPKSHGRASDALLSALCGRQLRDTEGDICEMTVAETSDNGDESAHESIPALYLLYTSGSTGRPKGVLGTHIGLITRLKWQYRRFPYNRGEVTLRRTPLIFVDAITEIFASLLAGVPLYLPPQDALADRGIAGIVQEAAQARISRVTLLPSQLLSAIRLNPAFFHGNMWPSLRLVVVSGEPCPHALVREFSRAFPRAYLVNLYGSTEVAGDVTYAVLCKPSALVLCDRNKPYNESDEGAEDEDEDEDTDDSATLFDHIATGVFLGPDPAMETSLPPIGIAIDGNVLVILDPDSTGMGELAVIGQHVALGYFQRPDETAAKFTRGVPVEIASSILARHFDVASIPGILASLDLGMLAMFRMGDLARFDAEYNCFQLCGRVDRQVKIRGVRVELDDVEHTIARVLDTSDISVLLIDFSAVDGDDKPDLRLVLVIASSESTVAIMDRLLHAEGVSPIFLPAMILPVYALPRTATGKVDRVSLTQSVARILNVDPADQASNTSTIEGNGDTRGWCRYRGYASWYLTSCND